MRMIEYNGLAHAQDKYVSLAYNIDSKWKIPLEKVAYILEPKTLHEERRSDILLEQLRVPELIDFVASHQKKQTLSVLNSIHRISQLTQNYLDATADAYTFGIKENVIERVYYFFPWVRCFQTDTALEVTFFTLVEYRNHARFFKIIKLVPDDLESNISIAQYLEKIWIEPVPTIHIDSSIYLYDPPGEEYKPDAMMICYNSILELFLHINFGRKFPLADAHIGLVGLGKLSTTDDKKPNRTARKITGSTCYVSVEPSYFEDYFSYAYKAYKALANIETLRDVLFAYKKLCKKHKLSKALQQIKDAYEQYLYDIANKQGIRLDMSLEEMIRKRKKRDLIDLVSTFGAKLASELLPS